jgi:predicted ATPase/DNA-binding SARP family transcriptional activator
VDIEVLGRPAVRIAGARVELKGRQPALLAALVIAAPRRVTSDALLDAVWGDQLPADPANALQQRISALRRVIDPDRTGEVLVTVPGGYALQIDDDRIDARRFARLVAAGRDRLAVGDLEAARGGLAEALAAWRGPAFDGLADEPWVVAEVQRLQQLRLIAVEDRIEAELQLGAGAELIPELTELVADEPLRERLAGQLMRALYRAGRQADALAHYERTRQLLAEELGVDPGPGLQRLHLQLLEQADELEVAATAVPRRPRAATNLPAARRTVIGRDAAIDRVGRLLEVGRLVTLTGPGGAGKTTVAIEVARRLPMPPDGTWLVELASLRDGAAVPHTVATALALDLGGLGGAPADVDGVADVLADRALLLVLDNVEHVVADVARLADALLARAPGVRLLATGREPLAVDGELVWSLPTLGVADEDETEPDAVLAAPAVQLLIERIRAHDPMFEPDAASVPAAATIARRLDGIPLAIELAAARTRVLPLPELADALDDRFAVLTGTQRSAPSRQRTLRGAIDWSWELLDDDQRAAWAALAVPADGADGDMAAALLGAAGLTGAPLDVVRDLVDRSLLVLDTGASPSRYRMLETIRAYGRERLNDLGLDAAVRARHAEVVLDGLERCHRAGDGAGFGVDLDGLSAWLDDARAALRWASAAGRGDLVQRLAGRLGWLWLLRGLAAEGRRWLDEGLGAVDGAPPGHLDVLEVDADALLWANGLRAIGADPHASEWAARSVAAAVDPGRQVLAELFAAVNLAHTGDVAAAMGRLDAAVVRAGETGGWLLGFAHLLTAQIGRVSGRMDQVRGHAEAALELLTAAGADWARAQATDILIDAVDPVTDPVRTRQLATEGLALCRRRGFPELEGRMLLQLGVATHASGDTRLAKAYLQEAVVSSERAGRGPGLGFALLVAGAHARQRGELEESLAQLTSARELLAGTAMPYGSARAALELARTSRERGDSDAVAVFIAEAVRLAAVVGDPGLMAEVEGFAAPTT